MIGILLIATRKYKQFINSLLAQIEQYFLPTHKKTVFLFTDEYHQPPKRDSEMLSVQQFNIPSYKFPEATLLRYQIFRDRKNSFEHCSHLFYTDVDIAIVSEVGTEILGEGLTAVRHPGFYNGGGSWETRPESTSYVPEEKRIKYFAGGFQGGSVKAYMNAIETMSQWIEIDKINGITPIWHDESAWNRMLSGQKSFIELDSGYCLVEQKHLRKNWGIDHLKPRIIALAKNHEEIRS